MILYILCVSFIEDYLEWTGICARNSLVRKSSDQTQPFHKQTEHRTSWHSQVCKCLQMHHLPSFLTFMKHTFTNSLFTNQATTIFYQRCQPTVPPCSTTSTGAKPMHESCIMQTCFLGKLQAFTMRENYGKLSNCQKCNQASVEFFPPLLFQGTREEGGKE